MKHSVSMEYRAPLLEHRGVLNKFDQISSIGRVNTGFL